MPKCFSRIPGALGLLGLGGLLLLGAAASSDQPQQPGPKAPYGWQLMSDEEKAAYRETLDGLTTPETRAAFRVEHREKMKARARAQGVDLSSRRRSASAGASRPGRGGRGDATARSGAPQRGARRPLGWEIMTEEERGAYKDTLRKLETREERSAFREEHRKQMRDRAEAQGVTLRTPETGSPSRGAAPGRGRVYGEKLMSEEERRAYREELASLEKGVTLPRPHPGRGVAAGPGAGAGAGAGVGANTDDDGS
jgi:hypothetical protein